MLTCYLREKRFSLRIHLETTSPARSPERAKKLSPIPRTGKLIGSARYRNFRRKLPVKRTVPVPHILDVCLEAVSVPAFGKIHHDMFNVSSSKLWPAVKGTLRGTLARFQRPKGERQ
jgi:hypothetical protein